MVIDLDFGTIPKEVALNFRYEGTLFEIVSFEGSGDYIIASYTGLNEEGRQVVLEFDVEDDYLTLRKTICHGSKPIEIVKKLQLVENEGIALVGKPDATTNATEENFALFGFKQWEDGEVGEVSSAELLSLEVDEQGKRNAKFSFSIKKSEEEDDFEDKIITVEL
jgi:hypothetical protein